MKLRIDMKDWDGNKQYAEYDDFQIGPADDWYRLRSLGKYSGNAGINCPSMSSNKIIMSCSMISTARG